MRLRPFPKPARTAIHRDTHDWRHFPNSRIYMGTISIRSEQNLAIERKSFLRHLYSDGLTSKECGVIFSIDVEYNIVLARPHCARYPCPGSTGSLNVLVGVSRQGSIAAVGKGGSDGWATGIRDAVWDGGAVHRALGGASLARWICLRRLQRAASLATEGAPAGL
jgi:hypothetical protein